MTDLSLRLQAKRNSGSNPPSDLLYGEIAYSDTNQRLYVGREFGGAAAFESGVNWEWDNNISLFKSKIKYGGNVAATVNGATGTSLALCDYLNYDSLWIEGVHLAIQNENSTGNLIIQARGLRADMASTAYLAPAFYSSGDIVSSSIKAYIPINQLIVMPNAFGNFLATYTRTLGSGGCGFLFNVAYRNVKP